MKAQRVGAIGLLLIFLLATAAFAEVGIFAGAGQFEIGEHSLVFAKIQARKAALKEAVEKALLQAVPLKEFRSKQKLIEKKILKKADKYVLSYEILDAKVDLGVYSISLEARVDLGRVLDEVRELGALPAKRMAPQRKILLIPTKRRIDEEAFWPALYDPLAARLEMIDLAALPVDVAKTQIDSVAFQRYKEHALDAMYDSAGITGARYALVIRTVVNPSQGALCPSMGTARFLDLANRTVLARLDVNLPEDVGCEQGAQAAAIRLFATLSEKLAGKGIFDAATNVATRITVFGLKSHPDTKRLFAMIQALPDVKSASFLSFGTGGQVTIQVTYQGGTQELVNALVRLKPTGFRLKRRKADERNLLFLAQY
jgi:hypothetical protein